MKYLLLLAFMAPAFVAGWCWPWLMDFTVSSRHGERWALCMYLAGVYLPMMVFCLLLLGVEWFVSRRRPHPVALRVMFDLVDFRVLVRGGVLRCPDDAGNRVDVCLADIGYEAMREEIDVLAEFHPRNWWSLYYHVRIRMKWKRDATHADCVAHLPEFRRRLYRHALEKQGHAWSEPAEGEPASEPQADG